MDLLHDFVAGNSGTTSAINGKIGLYEGSLLKRIAIR